MLCLKITIITITDDRIVSRTKHFAIASLSQEEEEAARMRMSPKNIFEEPFQFIKRDPLPLLGSPEDWKEINKNIDKKKLREYLTKLKH